MVGKSVTWSVKWPKKATEGSFMSVKSSKKISAFAQWFIRVQQLKEMQSSKLGMTERVTFVSGRNTKGAPFLTEMLYKKVRVGPRGGASLYKTLLSTPLGFE